jgi:hypothetical protein
LTIWHKDDVDNLTKRLSTLREQLAFRVLVLLNTNQSVLGQRLDDLNKDTKEIIEVLSINHNVASVRIENHHMQAGKWHKDSETLAAVRHEGVIAAILTLKDRSTLCRAPSYRHRFLNQLDPKWKHLPHTIKDQDWDPLSLIFLEIPKKVLDCLYFRAIKNRYEVVAEAHRRAFELAIRGYRINQQVVEQFRPIAGSSSWVLLDQWRSQFRQVHADEVLGGS